MEYKAWEELSELEQLQCIYSDAYKDAYGFRPRGVQGSGWNSVEWLKEQLAQIQQVIQRTMDEDDAREQESIVRFETMVGKMIENGAADRETALRWIMDAGPAGGDWEFLCFEHGLPYNYFKKVA